MRRPVLLVLAVLLATVPALATDYRSSTRADLIAAIHAYRAALDRLVEFHVAAVSRAGADVEKRRELMARGLVARRELEESERALEAAEAKLAGTRREMVVADRSLRI
jgi:multidrug resistance efflux pump